MVLKQNNRQNVGVISQSKSLGSGALQAEEECLPFLQQYNITLRYLQNF